MDLSSSNNSERASSPALVPNYKDELLRLRKKAEAEQQKRIKARAELEIERERLLVLEGKIKVKPEHLKDPILKLHFDCLKMEKRAKKATAKKLRRKHKKEKAQAIKMKWTSAKEKLKLKNFSLLSSSTETDTVVANLVYDEVSDSIQDASKDSSVTPLLDGEVKKEKHPNPVFQAFDDARNVDDLYRIAEIYVSPTSYYDF